MPFVVDWNIWWTKDGLFKEKTLSFLQLITKPLYSRSKFSFKHLRCGGKTNVVMYGTAKQEKSILGYIYCCMYGSAHKKSLAKLFLSFFIYKAVEMCC